MYEFDAQLQRLEGKMPWTVFYIPFSAKEAFDSNGRIYVKILLDDYPFEGILLPSKNGHYMLFNKDIQYTCHKKLGDIVHVKLEKNMDIKSVAIPDMMNQKLKEDKDLLQAFNALPHHLKKEEINKIMSAKKEETQIEIMDTLIKKLLD